MSAFPTADMPDEAHEHFRRLPDRSMRCVTCEEPWPCDGLRQRREQEHADNIQAAAAARGARTIGDFALLEIGCSVWSKTHVDYRGEPRGGVILDIFDKRDEDTGYVERAFRVIDPYIFRPHIRSCVLVESDIERDALEGPDHGRLRRVVRALASDIAKGKGSLTAYDLDHIAWMHKLAGVVVPAA